MDYRSARCPDGRTLEFFATGPEDGLALVFHHGTPGAAVPMPMLERVAAERDLRLVSYSRPGYAESTPRPDGTVADDARDTAFVLDALGTAEFISLGWSGGGPRSLACAAILPDRCLAATCGVGIAPAAAYDTDIRDGMGAENVAEYDAAFAGRAALEPYLSAIAPELAKIQGPDVTTMLGSLAPPVDQAALTGELADYLAAATRRAVLHGSVGWVDDDLTHIAPWGFDVEQLTVPTALWQGTEDLMVPFAHARWLAAHVANSTAHFVEGEGHLSLFMQLGRIVDDLLGLAGKPERAASQRRDA